ncbi:LysM peptidoglycan-binding domain-containing protein [Gimesia aquarii]|uniref:LysM domain/BON superfamily protein n=1 Tax=Gimesia aquarii TaxID=2527964 RepID=A0A517WWA0_9PLAN|nr:LysM peptidoglycan-binding domain-containing protein [Gimesia aquarii]QDU09534.1 LysM domain/BON superfamily protein [Gimesia aquarii]
MTEEKKAEKTAEEDWGIEKPKSGIAIETKVGLCLIFILLSAFGLVVYQKINRPQEDLAVNNPAEVESKEKLPEADPNQEVDPFGEGNLQPSSSDQVVDQSNGFGSNGSNSGFSTPLEGQDQDNSFAMQQSGAQGTDQFSQNTFENQTEPQQSSEFAMNQTDNGFQQFDSSSNSNNEFENPTQNEFQAGMQNQSEPATFDNSQQEFGAEQQNPFSQENQFAQQPTQTAQQSNDFNLESQTGLPPDPVAGNSGLREQPSGNEFDQSAEVTTNAFQAEEDPFGGLAQQGQTMQAEPQQSAENEFENFDPANELNSAQMQNPEEFSDNTAKINITDISTPAEAGEFDAAEFSQGKPQSSMAQNEQSFNQEFEQPEVSEFNADSANQGEGRFGNFRPEEFSAQQAESVTTVKNPSAAIDTSTFHNPGAMTEQQAPQAQGLFDRSAPTSDNSIQEFGALQEESFQQEPVMNSRGEYTVQHGENFWTISKKLYGTGRYFQLLAEINKNRVSDPQKMRPGTKLIAPDRTAIDARYQSRHKSTQTIASKFSGTGAVRKSSKPSGFFISQDGRPMYRVGSNDTLTDISQRHLGRSSRWFQIYQINRQKLQNPNKLKIGTELQLPYDASRVSLVPGNTSSR